MPKASKIDRREDVNPKAGKHTYGDVEFADTTKYTIDTSEQKIPSYGGTTFT
jgi:hypothetical protein